LKINFLAYVCFICLLVAACSSVNEEKLPKTVNSKVKLRSNKEPQKLFHKDVDLSALDEPHTSIFLSLKLNYLEYSSTRTIGEVFDSYKFAVKKEWLDTTATAGPYYIDYFCWFDNINPVSYAALKDGVMKRGLNIKFVVQESGETYIGMASRIDVKSDGMLYNVPIEPSEIKKIVKAIYENREIIF